MKITACLLAAAFHWALPHTASAQVVINEFQYDDTGTPDDREFIELYNAGPAAVDLTGWTLGGYDTATATPSATLPVGTTIPASGYYVLAYSQTLQAGSWLDLGNVSVAAGAGTFSDTDAVRLARPRGFYRAFLR